MMTAIKECLSPEPKKNADIFVDRDGKEWEFHENGLHRALWGQF